MYRVIEPGKVAIVFGAITMMSGIIGVPLGMFLSTELKVKKMFSDPDDESDHHYFLLFDAL